MRRLNLLIVGVLIAIPSIQFSNAANAAGLADCLYVSNAKFNKTTFDTTYEVTVNTLCDAKTSEKVSWSSVTFYADKSIVNGNSQTYYYNQFGNTFKFNISSWDYSGLKAGTQYPYIKIFSPTDFSYKTINLPTFNVDNPMECVSVQTSGANNYGAGVSYDIGLKKDCSSLGDRDFADLKFTLTVPGYSAYLSYKTVFSLSNYGTTLSFSLPGILKGTYYPTLQISDKNYNSKKLYINSFTVQGSGVSSSGGTQLQNCAYSSNIATQCDVHPSFIFEMCSSLASGTFQEKVGSKWVTLWKVKGVKDSGSCETKYPYLVSITGTNAGKSSTSMRIVFSPSGSMTGFTQLFTLKPVKK